MYNKYPLSYLEGLSDIMLTTQTLTPGQQYTFTFQKGGFFSFDFSSDADILQGLRERLANYGDVISVSRPFFSNRWVINVIPSVPVTVDQWVSAFETSWKDMGYDNISYWQTEEGFKSTAPGGMSETLPKVTGAVGEAVGMAVKPIGEALKPIIPFVVLGAGLYFLVVFGGPIAGMLKKK